MAGRAHRALHFLGLVPGGEQFAADAGKRFRTGGPGTGNVSSNDSIIATMAGEDIADGSAMSVGPWIARRNLIAGSCATLPLRLLDEETMQPIDDPPSWATPLPVGWQDTFDFKYRMFDGLLRRGSSCLRINSFDPLGYPDRMWALPMRWCQYNFMDQPTSGPDIDCDERASVIYTPPQRGSHHRRVLYEWFAWGDPIENHPEMSDKLVGVIRMRDDGTLGGENPTQLAAEVIGVALAALREAGLRFRAPGTGSILMADGWEEMEEWVESYNTAQNDPNNRNKPGFSDKKLEKVDLRPPPAAMQTREYLEGSVDQVAGLDNIPPMFLGKHGANYGTSVLILRNLLHSMVLYEYLDRVETWLTARATPDGVIAKFDTKKFLRGSEAEQEAMIGRSIRDAIRTPNEGRKELDMEASDDPEADKLHFGKKKKGERDDGTEERRAQKKEGGADDE